MFRYKRFPILGLLLLLTFVLTLYKSWGPAVYLSDELVVEDIAYGMAHGGSLIVPTTNGTADLLKPPLLYWITAPLYTVLPVTPFTRRLPMIGFALGLVIITYCLAEILFGRKAAVWSGLLLATSVPLIYFTKTTYFDLPNAFFSVAAIYLFMKATHEKRRLYYVLCAITEALALLNRSYLALFLPCLFLSYLYLTERKIRLDALLYYVLIPFFLVLPWHVMAYLATPETFLSQYIVFPFAQHVAGSIPGDYVTSPLSYFIVFILFPPSLLSFWFLTTDRKFLQPAKLLLLLWLTLYMAPLVVSHTKYEWYLLPMYPLLSIAAGAFLVRVVPKLRPVMQSMVWGLVFVSLCAGPVVLFLFPVPQAENVHVAQLYIASHSAHPLYIAHYPLVPITKFFLDKNAIVVTTEQIQRKLADHEHFFVMERPETAQVLPKPQKVYYRSPFYMLVYYE